MDLRSKRERLAATGSSGIRVPGELFNTVNVLAQQQPRCHDHHAKPAHAVLPPASPASDHSSPTSLLRLPEVLQQLIIAAAGKGSASAAQTCHALRSAYIGVLHDPSLFARFCVASWGSQGAVRNALHFGRRLIRTLPPQQQENAFRLLLREVAAAGGDLRAHTPIHIDFAIRTGFTGVMEELLQLLAALPANPQRGLEPGLRSHVSAICSALAHDASLPSCTRGMVELLVQAARRTTGGDLHVATWRTAVRNAGCEGNTQALAGLLAAGPPEAELAHALHYTLKTRHAECVAQLVEAGAPVDARRLVVGCTSGWALSIRALAQALMREGTWTEQMAEAALAGIAACGGSGGHFSPGLELEARADALRMLVSEFGVNPVRHGAASLSMAVTQEENYQALSYWLMLLGAEADDALRVLCSGQELQLPWLRRWRDGVGLQQLLAAGAESEAGAAAALAAAVGAGRKAQARVLLAAGAVSGETCAALLQRGGGQAVRREGTGREEEDEDDEVPAGAHGCGGRDDAHNRRRLADWAWEMARVGALPRDNRNQAAVGESVIPSQIGGQGPGTGPASSPTGQVSGWAAEVGRGAATAVERALEEACRQGQADVVTQLASSGVAGEASCTAAFWLAFEGGHRECMERLNALGAVSAEVRAEAARVKSARAALQQGQCGGTPEGRRRGQEMIA